MVACGFSQVGGIGYSKKSAQAENFMSVGIFFLVASVKGLHRHQINAISAFLNEDLNETLS